MNLNNARFADDPRPIDEASSAAPARAISPAPICAISSSPGEILGMMALTAINLAYYQDLMAGARAAIAEGRLADYVAETREGWARGEAEGNRK